jgi:hypothetical protein
MAGRTIFEFALKAATDLSFVPALLVIASHRRHFELWVGVLQLGSSFLYNSADAFDTDLFLARGQWHFLSDVMSITYVCVLALHYMQLRDGDANAALRYLAFTAAWVAKLKDGFGSTVSQAVVIVAFIGGAVMRSAGGGGGGTGGDGDSAAAKWKRPAALRGAALLVLAAAFLAAEVVLNPHMQGPFHVLGQLLGGDASHTLMLGAAHVLAGGGMYYLWQACPVMDIKQLQSLPVFC